MPSVYPSPHEDRRFIVIEGALGSGKTSLAKILSTKLAAKLLLDDENPFLLAFFKEMARTAFQLQIFTLLSRLNQQKEILQVDLFHRGVVCDYLFSSEHIFAEMHLSQDEFVLYDKLLRVMEVKAAVPDLVIYLQSKPETLYERLHKSGFDYGRKVPMDYLESMVTAYNQYFFHYKLSPLLVVNTEHVDFFSDERHVEALIKESTRVTTGVQHFVPFGEKP